MREIENERKGGKEEGIAETPSTITTLPAKFISLPSGIAEPEEGDDDR